MVLVVRLSFLVSVPWLLSGNPDIETDMAAGPSLTAQCRHVRLGILQRKCRFRTPFRQSDPKPALMEHAMGNVPFRPVATNSTTHEAPLAIIRHCHGCHSPLVCRVTHRKCVSDPSSRLVVPTWTAGLSASLS